MQTFQQTFASAKTWELNVAGSYFSTLECTQTVSVRFYLGGKQLDLGEIKGLAAGLEVAFGVGVNSFDRVQIDVQAGDTVKVGIGNGQARYNRGAATVTVAQNTQTRAAFANTAAAVTTASAQLSAANAGRQYLLIQNKDTAGSVWINFGAAATQANGVKIGPGGAWESGSVTPSNAVFAIGDLANNANVVVVEG
jgi:hypothetical protein